MPLGFGAHTTGGQMQHDLSAIRLWAMRFLYLLNAAGLGLTVWPYLIQPGELIAPVEGVAYAFWASLATLSALGVRFPVTMLPLLLLQFVYKLTWLVFIALPLWRAGQLNPATDEVFKAMAIGVAVDIVFIPWLYIGKAYLGRIFSKSGGV